MGESGYNGQKTFITYFSCSDYNKNENYFSLVHHPTVAMLH